MDITPFIQVFFNMIQKIASTLSSFSFTIYGVTVNPFSISIVMIIIYMVIYSYWKGSRA